MLEATIQNGVKGNVRGTVAPVMLTPATVEKMIAKRQAVQLAKFRTTCTDCLPNY